MEADVSLSAAHDPWPYPELDDCSPLLLTLCSYFIFISVLPFNLGRSPKLPLPFRFPEQSSVCLSHLTYACYVPYLSHSLPNKSGDDCKSWNSTLRDVFQHPVTSSLSFLTTSCFETQSRVCTRIMYLPAVRIQIMVFWGVETPCCLVAE
jgi:hypothetical protein